MHMQAGGLGCIIVPGKMSAVGGGGLLRGCSLFCD